MQAVFNAPLISNDQSFERLTHVHIPTAFVLWAGREMPTKLNAALVSLASDHAGQVIIARIHVDENPKAKQAFDATANVTLIGMESGKEVLRHTNITADELTEHIRGLAQGTISATSPHTHEQVKRKAMNHPVTVQDSEFAERVLQSDRPVLVDFWAPWCGPCQMIAPTLEKLARDYAGKITIAKINVDDNPHFAGRYGVQGIPTLLLFKDGKIIDRLMGVQPEASLRARLDMALRK